MPGWIYAIAEVIYFLSNGKEVYIDDPVDAYRKYVAYGGEIYTLRNYPSWSIAGQSIFIKTYHLGRYIA